MADPKKSALAFLVEIVFAGPAGPVVRAIQIPPGTRIGEAIALGGFAHSLEQDLSTYRVGVFGRLRRFDDVVLPGDRIEIYRPLIVDPNEARLRRAAVKARQKKMR
jgi:putative ubiquitin-RnfH superfamily antitoxin RatB of RatAB toxin-antitoxin module